MARAERAMAMETKKVMAMATKRAMASNHINHNHDNNNDRE
jgi:hypothetical protein